MKVRARARARARTRTREAPLWRLHRAIVTLSSLFQTCRCVGEGGVKARVRAREGEGEEGEGEMGATVSARTRMRT